MIVDETSTEEVRASDLDGFFVGWPVPPTPTRRLRALQESDHVVLARDEETGRLAGLVTAVADGALTAFVPLLEVLPEYQGRGIGSEPMRRLLAQLERTYSVDLCCDEELLPFYERLGMARLAGMGVRYRAALAD